MNGERNHSMGSPMDGTFHAVITITIRYDQGTIMQQMLMSPGIECAL